MLISGGIGIVIGVFLALGVKGGIAFFKARAEKAKELAKEAEQAVKELVD